MFIRQNSTKKAWAHHGRRIRRGKRRQNGLAFRINAAPSAPCLGPGCSVAAWRRAARRCAALTRRGHGKPTLFEPVNFLSAPEPGYRGRTRPSRTSRQGWTGGWMCSRPRRTSRRVGRPPKAEEDGPPRSDRPIPRPRRTGPLGRGRRPPRRTGRRGGQAAKEDGRPIPIPRPRREDDMCGTPYESEEAVRAGDAMRVRPRRRARDAACVRGGRHARDAVLLGGRARDVALVQGGGGGEEENGRGTPDASCVLLVRGGGRARDAAQSDEDDARGTLCA